MKDSAKDATQTTQKTIAEKVKRAGEYSTHHSIPTLKAFKRYLKVLMLYVKCYAYTFEVIASAWAAQFVKAESFQSDSLHKTSHLSSFCPERMVPKSHNCVEQC